MFFRQASMHRRSLKLLVKLIATEKDRHQLISRVASDVRLLREAQRLFRDRQGSLIGKKDRLFELCQIYQLDPDYFDEQLRLIVYILNLVEHHEDYYRELGLTHDACQEAIKHAFRQLCLTYHPDRISNNYNSDALERFLRINRAYEILNNEKLRREYDRHFAMPPWTEDSSQEDERASFVWRNRLYHASGLALLVILLLIFSLLIDYQDWQTIRHFGSKPEGSARQDKSAAFGIPHAGRVTDLPKDRPVENGVEGSKPGSSKQMASRSVESEELAKIFGADKDDEWLQSVVMSMTLSRTRDFFDAPDLIPNSSVGALEKVENGDLMESFSTPVKKGDTTNADDVSSKPEKRQVNDGKPAKKGLFYSTNQSGRNEEATASRTTTQAMPAPDAKTRKSDHSDELGANQDLSDRIQDFLNRYVHAYEQRSLPLFIALFEPGALENGERIADLIPVYRKTFQQAEWIKYKLRVLKWYSSRNHIDVNANARLSMQLTGQPSWESSGFINLRLVPRGNDFRVRSISYSFR